MQGVTSGRTVVAMARGGDVPPLSATVVLTACGVTTGVTLVVTICLITSSGTVPRRVILPVSPGASEMVVLLTSAGGGVVVSNESVGEAKWKSLVLMLAISTLCGVTLRT